jgi:hypothetical protein
LNIYEQKTKINQNKATSKKFKVSGSRPNLSLPESSEFVELAVLRNFQKVQTFWQAKKNAALSGAKNYFSKYRK